MVRIASALALFAMASSVLASPIAADIVAAEPSVSVGPAPEGSSEVLYPDGIRKNAGAVGNIAKIVQRVVAYVQVMVNEDIERRQAFTQRTAREVAAQFPGYSVVVCNVGYSLTGPGDELVQHTSYNAKVGSNVTFDILVFKGSKTFDRRGDGGFENWAYSINRSCTANGGHIHCP